MKRIITFFLAIAASMPMVGQAPQIPITGNIGSGGLFAFRNAAPLVMPSDANTTLSYPTTSAGFVKVTSAVTLTAQRNVVEPFLSNAQCFENATTGSQSIQIIGTTGTGVVIPNGAYACVQGDLTNYVSAGAGSGTFTALTGDATSTSTGGATTVTGLLNHALPSLATGYLHWNGTAFVWDTSAGTCPLGTCIVNAQSANQTINGAPGTNTAIAQTSVGNVQTVQPFTASMFSYGQGYDLGNVGSGNTSATGWSTQGLFTENAYSATRGIFHDETRYCEHAGLGDFSCEYTYAKAFGGTVAGSDEGATNKTIHMMQEPWYSSTLQGSATGGLSAPYAGYNEALGTTYINGNRFTGSGNLATIKIDFNTAPTIGQVVTVGLFTMNSQNSSTASFTATSIFTLTMGSTSLSQTFSSGTDYTPVVVLQNQYIGIYQSAGTPVASVQGGGSTLAGTPSLSAATYNTNPPGPLLSPSILGTTTSTAIPGSTLIYVNSMSCHGGGCTDPSLDTRFADGGFMLDQTQGGATATLGATTYDSTLNGMTATLTGGTVTASSAWGNIVASSCTGNGNGQYQILTQTTCNVTLGAGSGNFVVSGAATSCANVTAGTALDIGLSGGFSEQSYVVAVGAPSAGVQSITFCTRYAWNSSTNAALVMQGGPIGQAFVASSVVGSWPVAYPIVGATSTTKIYYSNCNGGGCNTNSPAGNLLAASTPITFYPVAEITGSGNGTVGAVQLGTNNIPFAVSDTVIGAPTSQYAAQGIYMVCNYASPDGSQSNVCLSLNDTGAQPQEDLIELRNVFPVTNPAPYAIKLIPYSAGTGFWQTMFELSNRPTSAIMHIYGYGSLTGTYNILADDATSGSGVPSAFSLTPSTGTWGFTNHVTALDFNGVPLAATGSSSLFLNQAGGYTAPTGSVSSVSNSDGTLTVTPTTGAVVASLALGHANTWTAAQTFGTANINGGAIKNTVMGSTAEYSNGTVTTAVTVNAANGNAQNFTLTNGDTAAITFTQPSAGTQNILLNIIQSATTPFSGAVSAGAGVTWANGGVAPTIPATASASVLVSCYLNGTTAVCTGPTTGGTGTVTDGSGTTTANLLALSTATAHALTYSAADSTTTHALFATAGAPAFRAIASSDFPVQYTKGSCTEAWGGSGTSHALTSGDDAVVNNTCYNDSGVTRTITAVKCRNDAATNTTTVNPTFGAAGTGTTILSAVLTCGSAYTYSASGTVTNAAWTTGTGIDPAMGGTLTGTSIALIIEYSF